MKAWHFVGTHKPFERVDIEEPTAGPGKVVVDVQAAGLCHSDVGILEDEKWLDLMTVPVVPGHETAGVISEVGEGVTGWKVGDKVAVWPMIGPFGYGGLGQIGARLAHLEGAEVYVAEIKEDVWDHARENGAVKVAKSITEFKDDQLDVIIDFAGFGTTTDEAIRTVKFQGRVVLVGMGRLEATIDTNALILGQVELVGSNGGSKENIATVLKWLAEGQIEPTLTTIDFEEIADGVGRLERGEVTGRLVARVAEG